MCLAMWFAGCSQHICCILDTDKKTSQHEKPADSYSTLHLFKSPHPLGLEIVCKEPSRKAVHFLQWRNVNKALGFEKY